MRLVASPEKNDLKRQSHEIFDLCFLHTSTVPRPPINTLKYFRILFRIRGNIREYVLQHSAESKLATLDSRMYPQIRNRIRKYFRALLRGLGVDDL
jgi:hypothetical protein